MATDLTHLGISDYDSAEEIANAVRDDLVASIAEYPGQRSSAESIGQAAYDVVMACFGQSEDADEPGDLVGD